MDNSVTEIIKEVIEDICDHYCKYPHEIEDSDKLYDICEHCPLNRL